MKSLLLLFFIMIFFIACDSGRSPKGIIGEKEMIDVLTDVHLVDGYASTMYADSNRNTIAALYMAIYKKHNTDSVGIRKSLEYYSRHPDELKIMYESVNAKLKALEKRETDLEVAKQMIQQNKFDKEQKLLEIRNKLKLDSVRNDSLNKQYIKIDTFKVVPLKRLFLQDVWKREKIKMKLDSTKKDSLKNARIK
ncbi:DUF4296 domain-containing protein [Arcticibacter eurypsychrophilus]|uniref:DUF4296 domain-containing protein n=1 Tax=Arcticibacter eurypsychrophilus TaxID=1434752 RepID=UPI00084CE86E|nr:DUF4296 domain-containing protein [Arcticibacter eurypsychrophilus]